LWFEIFSHTLQADLRAESRDENLKNSLRAQRAVR
jgi:hypothetical protein